MHKGQVLSCIKVIFDVWALHDGLECNQIIDEVNGESIIRET